MLRADPWAGSVESKCQSVSRFLLDNVPEGLQVWCGVSDKNNLLFAHLLGHLLN